MFHNQKILFPFILLLFWGSVFCEPAFAGSAAPETANSKISLDFVDRDIRDVVRGVSHAYKIPIIVEQGVKAKVTVHLEDVEVWDALQGICGANGLSFQRENGIFHIRREPPNKKNFFAEKEGKIYVTSNGLEIREFLKEFAKNTGLSIIFPSSMQGNVYANLQGVSSEVALSNILSANKYKLKKKNNVFIVEPLNFTDPEEILEVSKSGEYYSIQAEETSIRNLVRSLAEKAGLGIVLYSPAEEKLTLNLDSVSLEKALNTIFSGNPFGYSLLDSIILIGERDKHYDLNKKELFPLQFFSAAKATELLEKAFGSKGGSFFEVKEQNAVLLIGSSADLKAWRVFLEKIDKPIPQILLECLIVEFRKGKNFEIGLRSGASRKTAEGSIGIRGDFSFKGNSVKLFDGYGKIGILPDQFIVELASLEEKDLAEVLARPSISTLNGEKASIYVTNTSYYQVNQVSADGFPIVDYRSFNDGISLEITPTVTQSGAITIMVSPEIKTSSRSTGDGPRDISTRNLQTTVSLKTGETLCLGGLQRKTTSEVRSSLPFLGSIPLIGPLFQYVSEEEEISELAVFITPKVLQKEKEDAP